MIHFRVDKKWVFVFIWQKATGESILDKYEYKVRAEEIKNLIAKKEYTKAMKIADTIDWRRVKNVSMLCTVSDLYKVCQKYEEAREILLLAYERYPEGKMIIYSLCELSIKLDDVVQAVEYYKEFVQAAPKDNGRYILQYKLYEAQEVSIEERIGVLEELKHREFREKWLYELAFLYHRIGLGTKCVEECDNLILWFGEGKYVTKAMELKMLHAPLTPEQQKKYNGEMTFEAPKKEPEFEVPAVNVSEYAMINLQKELAENLKEVLGPETEQQGPGTQEPQSEQQTVVIPSKPEEKTPSKEIEELNAMVATGTIPIIKDPFDDSGEMNLATALAPELPEEVEEEPGEYTKEILTNLVNNQVTGEIKEIKLDAEEIYYEDKNTTPLKVTAEPEAAVQKAVPQEKSEETKETAKKDDGVRVVRMAGPENIPTIIHTPQTKMVTPSAESMAKEKSETFDELLSQEYDGQISLAVPEETKQPEQQITGQLSLEDIFLEWEKMKKENETKRAEAVRRRVKEQTSDMFSEFDSETKKTLMGQLDSMAEVAMREEELKGLSELAKASENEAGTDVTASLDTAELPEVEELAEIEEPSEETAPVPAAEEISESTAEAEATEEPVQAEEPAEKAEETEEPVPVEKAKEQEESAKEEQSEESDRIRNMTPEEKKLFGPFIQTKGTMHQILDVIDKISLAASTGNVLVTGEADMGSVNLARNIVKDVQGMDANFTGHIAKISGKALNKKKLEMVIEKLKNGALIVEKAGDLKNETVRNLQRLLERDDQGIIVILEDTKLNIKKLTENNPRLTENFNLRVDIEAMNNDMLVQYAKRYAEEQEYVIDEMGVLALYTRIAEMQTSEHSVTTGEIKEIVDEAIRHVNRKTIPHLMDIMFGKRYDDEDMIILREKDFS